MQMTRTIFRTLLPASRPSISTALFRPFSSRSHGPPAKKTLMEIAQGLTPKQRRYYAAYIFCSSGFMLFISDKLEERFPAPPEVENQSFLSTADPEYLKKQIALLEEEHVKTGQLEEEQGKQVQVSV